MEPTIESASEIKTNCAFKFKINPKDNEFGVEKNCVKQEESLKTLDTLLEQHFVCDCCDYVSENVLILFNHRQTHNSSNSVNFSKIKNFRKVCFYCPLQFYCMTFRDGYLNIQKEKSALKPSCDFCLKKCFPKKDFHHKCHLCNITSISTCEQLFDHMKLIHKSEEPYPCVVCGLTYPTLKNLKIHFRKHDGRYLKCELCPKKFCNEETLKDHSYIHSNERNFACEFCDSKFHQPRNLRQHIMFTHSTVKYACLLCSKVFSKKYCLRLHLRTHLRSRKKFKCDQCPKAYTEMKTLKYHKRIHSGEYTRTYHCNLCDKKYFKYDDLKLHRYTHLDRKKFDCNICKKKYSSASTLQRHLKTIHSEKDRKLYECDLCDKKFTMKKYVQSHRKVHTGEPLNECNLCYKKFVHPYTLKLHLDQHKTEEKL